MPNSSGSRSSGLIHRWVPPAANDMSVSFENNDAREALAVGNIDEPGNSCDATAAARVARPVMVERPKSVRQARRSLSIRMFAFGQVRCKWGNISFEKDSYPFQICMNHAGAVHVRQAVCNVIQLNRISARFCGGDQRVTHKPSAVHMFVLLDELVDVPVFHPLGDHREPAFAYRHSKQWYNKWMPEVSPGDSLSAEPLQSFIHTGITIQDEDSH
jgi:hypothetical protein